MLDPMIALDREAVRRRGFPEFVKRAWEHVEPAKLEWNWHIDEMAKHAQALVEQRITELVTNVPPGHSKSTVLSVLWQPWSWIERPWLRWFTGSYDGSLALRDAKKSFELLTDPWFCARWGQIITQTDQPMGHYVNTAKGLRFSSSVAGKAIGRHFHGIHVDDPVKPLTAQTDTQAVGAQLLQANEWWTGTMATRIADPKYLFRSVVMQRLHEQDLSRHCIDKGYTHLCLPMHFDPDRACITSVGGDRRTVKGEVLHPDRFPPTELAKLIDALGDHAEAQLEQQPAPPGGRLFKRETFQRFTLQQYAQDHGFSVLSLDCAFKDKPENDWVAAEIWNRINGKFCCFDSVLSHVDLDGTVQLVLALLARHKVNAILVEEKANGAAVISTLRNRIRLSNVLALNPLTSKYARAQAANVYYQASSVFHLEGAPWLERKENNLAHFPKARHDDDTDATTQALIYLVDNAGQDFEAAMRAWNGEASGGGLLQRHYKLG